MTKREIFIEILRINAENLALLDKLTAISDERLKAVCPKEFIDELTRFKD